MPVELRPLGVVCNIGCRYCYQNPQRDAANHTQKYHLPAMKAAIEAEKTWFTLFGGEPLLVPEPDLEDLWAWGFARHKRNGVQSNGVLINENHIRMFKKYNVSVGISIDGPDELNDVRWAGTLEKTRAATKKTEAAIRRLCAEKHCPSLIITLHRGNAAPEKIGRLTTWLQEWDLLGIRSVRLHILEVDHPAVRDRYALTIEENIAAFLHFAQVEKRFHSIKFDVFRDIRNLLIGRDKEATCIWTGCDPYTTSAVRGVEGNGQRSNCGRTNKEGVDFVKADTPGFERYLALYNTPQEFGGCQGCRYFLMCKGQCPGTAIDGDWRNRTEHCLVWKALFDHFEEEIQAEGKQQVLSDELRDELEALFVQSWLAGRNTKMSMLIPKLRQPALAAGNGSGLR
jgi:uncharacterized protein